MDISQSEDDRFKVQRVTAFETGIPDTAGTAISLIQPSYRRIFKVLKLHTVHCKSGAASVRKYLLCDSLYCNCQVIDVAMIVISVMHTCVAP